MGIIFSRNDSVNINGNINKMINLNTTITNRHWRSTLSYPLSIVYKTVARRSIKSNTKVQLKKKS